MYLTKQVLEKRILEEFDNIVFHNGTNLTDLLSMDNRLLLCSHIMNVLPPSIQELAKKFQSTVKSKEIFNPLTAYEHLVEEVIELGLELKIPIEKIYAICINKVSKLSKEFPEEYIPTKENLLKELSDVSLIIASISYIVNMDNILYDAILKVDESLYSKICLNIEEVKETVQICKNKGIDVRTHDLGNSKYVIVQQSPCKLVKSIGYKKPNLNHLFKK